MCLNKPTDIFPALDIFMCQVHQRLKTKSHWLAKQLTN